MKELIDWAEDHYWNSLEKDKDLIIKHLQSFTEIECKHDWFGLHGHPAALECQKCGLVEKVIYRRRIK